ncbi:apolipoprotein N-acyltransferase [Alcaligenaceae bacterium CGII-47]|nr:apolipoprotein N-acyltransferase [Alcaligenaceae bacterium CGII-47]
MPTSHRIAAWRTSILLVCAGLLQALSFASDPLPAWILPFTQILALTLLARHVILAASTKQAAWYGFVFGLAQFMLGIYWLTISMHQYGGLPMPLAIAALALLCAALALYPALAAVGFLVLCRSHRGPDISIGRYLLNAALWASCWTLAEWLRGTLFTGFPWLNIGYAHVEGMFAAWAPFVGVYGVAWLAAFTSGAIALMVQAKDTPYDHRAALTLGVALITGLLGIAWTHINWAQAQGQPIVLRLVQTNTPQSQKFDPAHVERSLIDAMQLAGLAPKAAEATPQLIILPETVIPAFQDQIAPTVWLGWQAIAARLQTSLLLGVPLHHTTGGSARYTNGAIAFDAQTPLTMLSRAQTPWHYDKHHLVPFGEFIPPGFHWFVRAMHIPLGDFDRGAVRQPPLRIGTQALAVDICYEDVFGEEIIQSVRPGINGTDGASILVNISNLAWFGDTWALRQHLQISRMRALETARPIVRATNTGMTAAIDPRGQVRATLDPATRGVLDVEVQGTQGLTPYVRWGNTPILIWIGLWLLLGLWRRRTPTGT